MNCDDRIATVRLELLRPGETHGQLLSPLTPYLVLCGDDAAVTLQIPFEHWRMLTRLERLRYVTADDRRGMIAQPDASRESELEQLGRDIGKIFADITTLGRQLGDAAGRRSTLVHLRLLISGSELAILPFELLVSPIGFPGKGRPLLLQNDTPIVMTREIRRLQHRTPVKWNRPPRILFVSAAPGGMHVPTAEHLRALRGVIEPWVGWADDERARLNEVRKHLTIITNASLDAIKASCERNDFTHVHLLAHGGSFKMSGETRYGVVLCDKDKPNEPDIVDGNTLAEALHVSFHAKAGASAPLVVSLATCDSGNPGSVIAPGASIAHSLHDQGVPWVVASQFPLTKRGSVAMTQKLYEALLWGEDPRSLLASLRMSLHIGRGHDHDWASLVTYASVPDDLDEQVDAFRSQQYQRAVDNDRARAEHFQKAIEKAKNGALDELKQKWQEALQSARDRIRRWQDQLLPIDDMQTNYLQPHMLERRRRAHAECYGVQGATEKKIAEVYFRAKEKKEEQEALKSSLHAYRESLRVEPNAHWPATQALSLLAITRGRPDPNSWFRLREITKGDVHHKRGVDKAWALGTLAELELLGCYHAPKPTDWDKLAGKAPDRIAQHCRDLVATVGWDDFAVLSTRRQFQRYIDWWQNDHWQDTAEAAIKALTPPAA